MSARCAWAAVAVLSVGVYVAVGWTASKVTEFRANNANLTQQLRQASDVAEQKTADAERYRDERDKAREAAARSDGELSATKASLVRKPATQPTLLEKIGLVRSAD
jgi:small-conductance mechanosensitive channel